MVAFLKMEVEKWAASSAWSLNHRHAVIFCILASPCMISGGANQIPTYRLLIRNRMRLSRIDMPKGAPLFNRLLRLRRMPMARDRLQHTDAITLGVGE